MIMISSPAGQRLARAKVEWRDSIDRVRENENFKTYCASAKARREFARAAEALADELIADNHHLEEGD